MPVFAGIDIGSVATKAVLLRDGDAVGYGLAPTGAGPKIAASQALATALETAGLSRNDVARVCATGYGRRATDMADETITEITAAALGARRLCGDGMRILIDVGGQDTKVISLDERGRVMNFLMNDKCAAGTGKFLEVMAHVLGVDLPRLAELAAEAGDWTPLSATCTVFAESEVISLIHRHTPKPQIAASLHMAIATRIAAMAAQLHETGETAFIGGGARNDALRRMLERTLDRPLHVPERPQFIVAVGAAFIAARHAGRN